MSFCICLYSLLWFELCAEGRCLPLLPPELPAVVLKGPVLIWRIRMTPDHGHFKMDMEQPQNQSHTWPPAPVLPLTRLSLRLAQLWLI